MDPEKTGATAHEPQLSQHNIRHSPALGSHRDSSSSEHEIDDIEAGQHGSKALGKTVTAQDWNGPDDPENPHNWPAWKRIYHTVIPALFGLAV